MRRMKASLGFVPVLGLILALVSTTACWGDPDPEPEPTTDIQTTIDAAIQAARPTETPTPDPTATPIPTQPPTPNIAATVAAAIAASRPTDTPVPTLTPTPEPTPTPELTPTPEPTPTPKPTAKPEPTPTPLSEQASGPPCIIAGTVRINGAPAPAGIPVFAHSQDASVVIETVTDNNGRYVLQIPHSNMVFDLFVRSTDTGEDTPVTSRGCREIRNLSIG